MTGSDRAPHGGTPLDPTESGTRGERAMQDELGTSFRAGRFYSRQMSTHLNPSMIEFVRRMDLLFIGTAGADGSCDVSLRAGPPGFVKVFAADLLGYPEYQGNGVMAGLGNIVENPHIGLFMADFVTDLIGLHVNGTASVVPDEEIRLTHPDLPPEQVRGRRAERWVLVHVEEAYIHCRKHIPRMIPADRIGEWGADDPEHRAVPDHKGGDYFGVAAERGLPR